MANVVSAAEVKGVGLPTPTLEKQIAMENKEAFPPQLEDSDEETDLIKPSEEDLATLRRVPAKLPWIAFTVAFVELCERFAYYGTTAVMVNFIQQPRPEGSTTGNDPRPDGQPGALDAGQRASTGLVLFNVGAPRLDHEVRTGLQMLKRAEILGIFRTIAGR